MTHRSKVLWIPGAVTLTLSVISYRVLSGALGWGGSPDFGPLHVYVDFRYLLSLPFIGVLGAYWSVRAGGMWCDRLLAATFPAICQLTVVAALAVNDVMVGHSMSWNLVISAVVQRALIPGVALLVGALPFLWMHGRPVAARDA